MNETIARCRYSTKNVEALIKFSVLSTFNLSNLGKHEFVNFFDVKISCAWYKYSNAYLYMLLVVLTY